MPHLANKVALITGASRGIGAAIAQRLANDGAAVAITFSASAQKANELDASITKSGGRAVAILADAADPHAAKNAVKQTIEKLGRLDILVNNAGIATMAPIDQYPDADFERMLSINVRSVYYTTREAVNHLAQNGRIINIGSVNSDNMPFAGGSVYALTKGAVASFTRGLARDLAPRGITVNNIQPGPINTDMNPDSGPFAQTLLSLMAIKRFGKPSELAALVSFLASDDAAYITGAQIKFDGGFDA